MLFLRFFIGLPAKNHNPFSLGSKLCSGAAQCHHHFLKTVGRTGGFQNVAADQLQNILLRHREGGQIDGARIVGRNNGVVVADLAAVAYSLRIRHIRGQAAQNGGGGSGQTAKS